MRLRATIFGALVLCGAAPARAQDPAPVTAPPSAAPDALGALGDTSFVVENLTRVELWRFFEPLPGAGVHPEYAFIGNRSTLGVRYDGARWSTRGAIQYVRLENLPTGAIGPGLLGTGGAYFFHAGGTFSYQFYLRSLSLTYKHAANGAWVEAGRFLRAAAEEPTSGDATIDALTRASLNGRLLGDMEWSMYQRAWDGVRGGVARGGWRATVTAAMPTQGTYEESANLAIDTLRVAAVETSTRAGTLVPHTAVSAFAYAYDDRRRVTARPDNHVSTQLRRMPLPARVDVRIGTAGASAVSAFPHASGRWDALTWAAVQAGDWYGQRHRAVAAAVQGGHQWTRAPWQPWLRMGVDYASGDEDPFDGSHGTFFPMLPSGNHLSRSSSYALMNLVDAWVEARVVPTRAVDLQVAAHSVGLASPNDGWYAGSGATTRTGNYFGFQTRYGIGARSLGTVVEGEVAWRPVRWWTLRAYAGRMAGGGVVRQLFARDRLLTAWVESLFGF